MDRQSMSLIFERIEDFEFERLLPVGRPFRLKLLFRMSAGAKHKPKAVSGGRQIG